MLLIAAVALVALLWWTGEQRRQSQIREGVSNDANHVDPGMMNGRMREGPELVSTGDQPPAERSSATKISSAVSAESSWGGTDKRPSLRGTIIVFDEHQRAFPQESGTFKLGCISNGVGVYVDVVVVNGSWQANVSRPEQIQIDRAILGGQTAFALHGNRTVSLTSNEEPQLQFRWTSFIHLYVRDRAEGRDLSEIEVIPTNTLKQTELQIPSPAQREVGPVLRGSSPMTLSMGDLAPLESASSLFVRAKGHAWTQVRCDFTVGGDVYVELELASALRIELRGESPREGDWLRILERNNPKPIVDLELSKHRQLLVDSIAVGEYLVLVQTGDWRNRPLELARAEVSLSPGELHSTILDIDRPPGVEVADYAGQVELPNNWGVALGSMRLRLLDPVRNASSEVRIVSVSSLSSGPDCHTYQWRANTLQPGHYEVDFFDPPYSCELLMPENGASGLRIEVPPAASVSFRPIDATTNMQVPVPDIGWYTSRPKNLRGWGVSTVSRDDVGSYTTRCPIGGIEVTVFPVELGYAPIIMSATVARGDNVVDVPLHRATGMTVVVDTDSGAITVNHDWIIDVESLEKSGTVLCRTWTTKGLQIQLSNPGTYRIRLRGDIPGYLTPDWVAVDIPSAQMKDVFIHLKSRS